jgi:TRAP-type C4-dicarboxylate transport system permease small subunit
MAIMLVANIVNLALRNITGSGLVWVWAWTGVLFVWMTFFAFFVIYRRHVDITVEIVVLRFSRFVQFLFRLFVDLLALGVMGVILVESPRIFTSQVGVLDFVGLERYVLSIPLIASCVLIALQFLYDLIEALATGQPTRPRFFEEAGPSSR